MNDHLKAHRDFQQVMDDSMSKLRETSQTWLQQRQEQVVNLDTYTPEPSQYRKIPICYDDDDDDVEDLVHTPSESDGISESECDFPVCDDSSPKKDEVLDIISIPSGNGNDHFNAESSPIESVLNRDNVISSPKINFLLEKFADELALIALISPGIVEADLDPKGDIRFIENLMYDNSFSRPPETLKDDSETVIDSNNDYSSSDGDSYEDIDYVDASPPHSELVSLEEVKDFHPEDGEIEDDILREKLSKINLLVAKIEALNANPTPSSDFVLKSPIPVEDGDSFLEKFETTPELETFKFDIEEKNSGSTTIHAVISLSDLECFYFKSEPDPHSFMIVSPIREISLWMWWRIFLIIQTGAHP
ncbi:hypothetical protein Tco_0655671 [Tanacetum coccineum]|uniref:Uncharacterized protein n=1 Tax=Tanacetum coccineum TaxID=301880 RepID=A0ABQ4X6N4_9ASTR